LSLYARNTPIRLHQIKRDKVIKFLFSDSKKPEKIKDKEAIKNHVKFLKTIFLSLLLFVSINYQIDLKFHKSKNNY
ncbi:MAG: hypothetical protein ACK5B9_14685, partial [Flavobacteriia bacterium]